MVLTEDGEEVGDPGDVPKTTLVNAPRPGGQGEVLEVISVDGTGDPRS